jgi:DNA repair exonuclease SbcCD ATPase subunit
VRAHRRLTEKISRAEAGVAQLEKDIDRAQRAPDRIAELVLLRNDEYRAVFEALIEEEGELSALYEPLRSRLQSAEGALSKLSFSVRRTADVQAWAQQGESLLDLRKAGPFRGKGMLLEAATADLEEPWETGPAVEAADALSSFRAKYDESLIAHSPVDRADSKALRSWAASVSTWLYGTDHIKIAYGMQYEGVEIEELSPGTRGIVLLLLYLALDADDDRPLLIDQPEENLDPKSIYDELVDRFRSAKRRRQIVIVTHNPNLVVNTDADQVVIATCGPHRPGELPEISYQSGGLENPAIRQQVCEILEGGEAAFKERARRLRVRF